MSFRVCQKGDDNNGGGTPREIISTHRTKTAAEDAAARLAMDIGRALGTVPICLSVHCWEIEGGDNWTEIVSVREVRPV